MRRLALLALLGLALFTGAGDALAQQPAPQPTPPPPRGSEVVEVKDVTPRCDNPGVMRMKDQVVVAHSRAESVFFWLFAVVVIGGALTTITRRNLVTAVMWLVATFMALSALYVMLYASFLAVIQVLVYAGAIMVLFVFVVMILNKEEEEPWAVRSGVAGKVLGIGALVYLVVRTIMVLGRTPLALPPAKIACDFGSTMAMGNTLFSSYLFPFEAVSLVLLIAVVGALVLAHPGHPNVGEEEAKAEPS